MTIRLIKFKKQDILFLYKLRNNKESRKYAINTKKIHIQEHIKWFNQKLFNKEKIFIIKFGKHNVGYIRLEKKINWLLSTNFRFTNLELTSFACFE